MTARRNSSSKNEVKLNWLSPDFRTGLVSVVITTHRRPELLSATLSCFGRQDYRPLELIVVSDGEDPQTEEIAARWEDRAGMTSCFETQPHAGASAARNRGARLSRGEYIVFVDDDDLFEYDFVSARMEAISRSAGEATLAFGPYREFCHTREGFYIAEPNWQLAAAHVENPWIGFLAGWGLLLQGCLLQRQLVNEAGPWDESLLKSQDFDYKLRLLATDCRVAGSHRGYVYYRRHEQSITRTRATDQTKSIVDAVHCCRSLAEARKDFGVAKPYVADWLWYFGMVLMRRGQYAAGHSLLVEAVDVSGEILGRQPAYVRWLFRLRLIGLWGRLLSWKNRGRRIAIIRPQNGPHLQLGLRQEPSSAE